MTDSTPENIAAPASPPREATLPEDVLLVLLDPASGAIAGETTLYYVLGGAAVTDLALHHLVEASDDGLLLARGDAPTSSLLRPAWDHLHTPRAADVIAAVGPGLREPVIEALLARGSVVKTPHRMLGFIPSQVLRPAGTHRDDLVSSIRRTLVDGRTPDERTAVLIALLSASGQLHTLSAEIPWTSEVAARAKELESASAAAVAVGSAITQVTIAMIAAVVAAAAGGRG